MLSAAMVANLIALQDKAFRDGGKYFPTKLYITGTVLNAVRAILDQVQLKWRLVDRLGWIENVGF